MLINLNADPEFREMVAREVRSALVTGTRNDVLDAVQEGIRRAVGACDEKLPSMITQQVQGQVREKISEMRISDMIRQAVRDAVREEFITQARTAAAKELDTEKIKELLKGRLNNLHVSIVL